MPSDEEVFRLRDEVRSSLRGCEAAGGGERMCVLKTATGYYSILIQHDIQEKKNRIKQREENMKLKVWQKGNTGALAGRTLRLKEMTGEGGGGPPGHNNNNSTTAAGVINERRQEKEIMTEFIAKKREMFLVQMSLDTKVCTA